jgi:hypothetical protein
MLGCWVGDVILNVAGYRTRRTVVLVTRTVRASWAYRTRTTFTNFAFVYGYIYTVRPGSLINYLYKQQSRYAVTVNERGLILFFGHSFSTFRPCHPRKEATLAPMRLLGLARRVAATPPALKGVHVVHVVQPRRHSSNKLSSLTVSLDVARCGLPELQVSTARPSSFLPPPS